MKIIFIVHYRAWTESTQHKFEDTWHEQQPLELVIGKGIYPIYKIAGHSASLLLISFYLSKLAVDAYRVLNFVIARFHLCAFLGGTVKGSKL